MKKYLFMAMAAVAITSCSQDEVMEVAEKQAINFGNTFVENATRAIDATYNNTTKPKSFLVYGNTQGNESATAPIVPIFKGVAVSSEGTGTVGNDYKYDATYTQYWIEDNKYNFAAVVHGEVAEGDIVNGLPTKISYNASNQEDLLYAEAKNIITKPANGEVGFTFNHLLAKAMFTVRNTMTTNTADYKYQYRVTNICINNAALTADYTVGAETPWGAAKTTYSVENPLSFGNVTENASTKNGTTALLIGAVGQSDEATSHHQRVLIPATYTYDETNQTGGLNITCTIETLLNNEVVDSQDFNKSISYTFAPGNAYNFIISLGLDEPIKFTVTEIINWVNQTPGTEIYQ